jgi:hypothetical protein
MATHAKKPLIQVSPETKECLDKLGSKGDTYDSIIVRLLNGQVKRNRESQHHKRMLK